MRREDGGLGGLERGEPKPRPRSTLELSRKKGEGLFSAESRAELEKEEAKFLQAMRARLEGKNTPAIDSTPGVEPEKKEAVAKPEQPPELTKKPPRPVPPKPRRRFRF
jgi:hypothetical protein